MMSNIMLMFLLLLFLAGDVEKKNLALGTHQSRKPTTNLYNIHTIQYKIYNIIQTHRHLGSFQ
jgi:hypothetical protein